MAREGYILQVTFTSKHLPTGVTANQFFSRIGTYSHAPIWENLLEEATSYPDRETAEKVLSRISNRRAGYVYQVVEARFANETGSQRRYRFNHVTYRTERRKDEYGDHAWVHVLLETPEGISVDLGRYHEECHEWEPHRKPHFETAEDLALHCTIRLLAQYHSPSHWSGWEFLLGTHDVPADTRQAIIAAEFGS